MSKDIVRVLLVEDSPSDARLLRESLEDYSQQRFEIECAERLDEAEAFLRRDSFDVVLLDLNLPDSGGMETCRRMARAAGQVPILILTGADDEAIAAQAMRLGIQDYLVKSQAVGRVIGRTIRYAVERSQAQEALRQANERLQDQAEELQSQAEELRTQAEELRSQTGELAAVNANLRQSEARLYLALESGRVGIWEWEVSTERVEWSQGIYTLLGYTPGAVVPTREALRRRIHPQDLARYDQTLRESMERCEDHACEFRVVWADGSEHWVESRGQYAYVDEADGIMLRMRGVLSDIDRRKQAEADVRAANQQLQTQSEDLRAANEELRAQQEELQTQTDELRTSEQALRESEQRHRSLFENMLDGCAYCQMLFDGQDRPADFLYLRVNDAFARLTGLKDVVGKKVTEVIPGIGRSHPELLETYGRVATTGQPERVEMEFKPLGIWLSISIYSSRQGYFTAVFDNITERKRAEAELQHLNEELEQRVAQRTAELLHRTRQLQKLTLELSETEDRERKRMAEILHDDLQQVLAAAKFHVSLLRNRVKRDPSLEATAGQIDQMLKDAIEKSRSLSHELSPAVLYHGDLAETLRWLAGEVQAKHGLLVHVHAQGQVRLPSETLKGFLYKTAQELLFNVVKHARVREARIRVRQYGRGIGLSVSDRGRGFDPRELRDAAGFGLLNIRERVELLGGRMKIKSVQSQGSRFLIVVPAGQEIEDTVGAGPRVCPTSAPPGDRGGAPLRVLLADDHEIVRQGLVSLLSEEDTVEIVGEAANGREAVDLADRLRPDVVIMDVSMPVMSGDEATRQIKKDLPQTRIIALSMWEESEVREKMYRAGAESYVLKTAPSEELLAAIRGRVSDS